MDSQAIYNQPTLVICEGSAESVIFELLLAEGKLIIPKDSLIEDPQTGRLYTRCRKDRDIEERFLSVTYGSSCVNIVRIIDSPNERFHLSPLYQSKARVFTLTTRPEIEILAIIKEGAYRAWTHVNNMKPSEFCKEKLGLRKIKQYAFLRQYWNDADELCRVIEQYRRNHHFQNHERCLAEILVDYSDSCTEQV